MLYHSDIYMPKKIKGLFPNSGSKHLRYGNHSKIREKQKGIELPSLIKLDDFILIELEVCSNQWNKAVIRSKLPDVNGNTIVIVVMKTELHATWFVKTVWYNHVTDTHKTLCVDGYERK